MSIRECVEQLVELMDKHAQTLGDWQYMKAMTLLMSIYHAEPTPPPPPPLAEPVIQYRYIGYGASAQQLCADHERLTANHNRLKRRQKATRKQWKETEAALRQQIEELLREVEYQSQPL